MPASAQANGLMLKIEATQPRNRREDIHMKLLFVPEHKHIKFLPTDQDAKVIAFWKNAELVVSLHARHSIIQSLLRTCN